MKSVNLLEFRLAKKVDDELSDTIYYECQFCNKIVSLDEDSRRMCEKVSGGSFFCPFCIRHGFSSKSNRDVFMLSFRGVIGYYYYAYYCHSNKNHMYLSQIRDLIETHAWTGLENPVFSYDPETFMWFVDFSRVGQGKRKLSLDDVLLTTEVILKCFGMDDLCGSSDFGGCFTKAIEEFYSNRHRPLHQKQLIPTLNGIGDLNDDETECIRHFTYNNLILRS